MTSHVGKYDRADDRPKLAMLAANFGYRYWTGDRSSAVSFNSANPTWEGHFDNGTLHKVTQDFHLTIRNILELTTCPVIV